MGSPKKYHQQVTIPQHKQDTCRYLWWRNPALRPQKKHPVGMYRVAQILPTPPRTVHPLLPVLWMRRKFFCDIHGVPADGELCLPGQLGRDPPAAPSMQEINTVIGAVCSTWAMAAIGARRGNMGWLSRAVLPSAAAGGLLCCLWDGWWRGGL